MSIYDYDGSPRDSFGAWPVRGDPFAVSQAAPITLLSGQERLITVELENPPLEKWWPHEPNLYVAELRIGGSGGDCVRERIGFREFWTEGSDF